MKILHIVIRNTSTLDFSIPYLCELRKKYPDAEISVLYCLLNRSQILRDAKYYKEIFDRYEIKQFDYLDFFHINSKPLKRLLRWFFSLPYFDNIAIRSYIKNPFFMKGKAMRYILAGLRKKLDEKLCERYVDSANILPSFSPDIILYDHRAKVEFIGRQHFYQYFQRKRIPLILIPHATHFIGPTDDFMPFGIGEVDFPEYCDHWACFKYQTPWLQVDEAKRGQFAYTAHPGLDENWLQDLDQQESALAYDPEIIRCLVMSRKFLPEGVKRTDQEPGVLEFDGVVALIKKIDAAFRQTGKKFEIVVKPHPSSSYPENIRVMERAGVEDYQILYEPFFSLMPGIDMVVTEFSTSIAYTVLSNRPTIVLNTPLQQHVHESWDVLEDMYGKMQYFLNQLSDLPKMVGEVVKYIDSLEGKPAIEPIDDLTHFRQFHDADGVNRAVARTEYLLGMLENTSNL